jgi:hypothetical protein
VTAFHTMHDALYTDPNIGADADYEPVSGGAALPCRVILSQPTEVLGVAGMEIAADTTMIEVRRAQVPSPVAGDTFAVRDAFGLVIGRFIVQGEPKLDDLRINWLIDTRPQGI